MLKRILSASSVPMLRSPVLNTMLSFENVHSFEPTGFARALAVAEKGDEESARLSDLSMDSVLKAPIGKFYRTVEKMWI